MASNQRFVYLIRHGATEANVRRPYVLQGRRSDLPLNEIGRIQAQAACQALRGHTIAGFFSSPLRRAGETAEILAQPHGLSVQTVDDLTECDVGRWEGMSWEQVRQQDPEHWEAFDADPGSVPYAGGESFQQVQDRVVPAIRHLIRDHPDGDFVVVTHNIVARVYVAHLTETPIAKARQIRQDNAGITVISVRDGIEKLVTLNSVLHLDGLLYD